ncbi:MAG: 3-hydroxyacyl-ACP dehydratase FabZ [Candidatus Desulfatibia sp.]|uniref:3-hydroxyacyl-ACP dehydratase FabZ n=1 Tax=Candidatus Desulfatibia sp. TaxID=3101189 RepID=UPI002F3285B1
MTDQLPYDVAVIKEILPHRSPFLFVDRVVKINYGENIAAEKDLSPDEWFFSGHFPGKPIVPGVIVSEALAQTSGLLLGLTLRTKGREQADLFLANLTIKFVTPAKPGETIRLAAALKKTYGKMFLFEVAANVLNRRIAKGTLILAVD